MNLSRKVAFIFAWGASPFFYSIEIIIKFFQSIFGYYLLLSIKDRGTNCRIRGYGRYLSSDEIKLGKSVSIGEGALFVAHGSIKIGNHTIISRNCTIRTRDHNFHEDDIPFSENYTINAVSIGDGVWIGMNVTINPGVNIGNYSIIASNAVVTKDVPSGEVWGGLPAKKISSRDLQKLKALALNNKWRH